MRTAIWGCYGGLRSIAGYATNRDPTRAQESLSRVRSPDRARQWRSFSPDGAACSRRLYAVSTLTTQLAAWVRRLWPADQNGTTRELGQVSSLRPVIPAQPVISLQRRGRHIHAHCPPGVGRDPSGDCLVILDLDERRRARQPSHPAPRIGLDGMRDDVVMDVVSWLVLVGFGGLTVLIAALFAGGFALAGCALILGS